MADVGCEVTGCSLPGTRCPACEQCFCWQHLHSSSCETCHNLLAQRSFEHRLGRLVGIGLSMMLCGFLLLLLPRDENKTIIQVAVLFLVTGSLLVWLGMLAGP